MKFRYSKLMLCVLLVFLAQLSFGKDEFVNDSLKLYTSIEEAMKDSLSVKQLKLKKSKLEVFPVEILSFSNLEYLDLSKNKLDSMPDALSELKHLKVLVLSKNQFTSIPSVIYEMEQLQVLLLGNNEVTYISPSIGNLTHLHHLDLWSTNVFEFPDEISRLDQLKVLDLRGISLNINQQSEITELIPNAKIYFSPPCNCNF